MSFISFAFTALLAVVLAARWTIGRDKRSNAYLVVLLVASLVFYGWHVPGYLLIVAVSTIIDYLAGLALERGDLSGVRRKSILAISLVANLGLLAYFKYANFALDTVSELLRATGLGDLQTTVNVVLPMGISFYTFQSMSYTIDVYRRKLRALARFDHFLLYVVFFPQLVAGPIVRATDFIYQITRRRRVSMRVFNAGVFLIVRGAFLKVVCADNIGRYVDASWEEATNGSGAGLVFNVGVAFLFSAQIFYDFAGYSSMARGLGYLLGFRLPVNFNAPYVAATFSDFWRRWHITLSTWLRDYLYISLGGNRVSRRRTAVNLMLVMLLGGLWHGAAMTFVAWGALHGVALAVERGLGLNKRDAAGRSGWRGVAYFVLVQAVVLLAWVMFRAPTIEGALSFVANATDLGGRSLDVQRLVLCLPMIIMHVRTRLVERGTVPDCGGTEKAALTAIMLLATILLYGKASAFIYFQF